MRGSKFTITFKLKDEVEQEIFLPLQEFEGDHQFKMDSNELAFEWKPKAASGFRPVTYT